MKGKLLVAMQFLLLASLALSESSNSASRLEISIAIILALLAVFILFKSFKDLGSALTPLPESK